MDSENAHICFDGGAGELEVDRRDLHVSTAIPGGEAFAVEGRSFDVNLNMIIFMMSEKDADWRCNENVLEMEFFGPGGERDGIASDRDDGAIGEIDSFRIRGGDDP